MWVKCTRIGLVAGKSIQRRGRLGSGRRSNSYLALGNKSSAPSFYGMLAELEAMRRDPDCALMLIEKGLAIADETGEHFTDPYLHRIRGEILLSREPANSAPAEEAFQTAIAIAKGQSARSYELLAALSLAKLYQSVGRLAEAHAVLAPAARRLFADAGNAGDR